MDGGVLVVFHSKVTFTTRPAFGTYNNGVEYNLVPVPLLWIGRLNF
jgi:hypothetical protein